MQPESSGSSQPAHPLPTGVQPHQVSATPPPSPPHPGQVTLPPKQAHRFISNPFQLFGPSWQALKLNFVAWLLLVLLLAAAEIVLGGIPFGVLAFGISTHNQTLDAVGGGLILVGLIGFLFVCARFMGTGVVLMLASARGQRVELKQALAAGRPHGWRLIGFCILWEILLIIGFILLIVPGILVLIWYLFTPFLIVDENLGIGQAMKRSKQLVKGRFWETYGLYSMFFLFGVPEFIPFIGVIIAYALSIIYLFALPIRYVMLKSYSDAGTPLPKVSGANYILPLLQVAAVVVFGIIFALTIVGTVHKLNTTPPNTQPASTLQSS